MRQEPGLPGGSSHPACLPALLPRPLSRLSSPAQAWPEPLSLLSIHRRRKSGGTKNCCRRRRRRRSRRGCGRRPRPRGWRNNASRSGSWRSSASRSGRGSRNGRGSRSGSRLRGEGAPWARLVAPPHGAKASTLQSHHLPPVCVWMREKAVPSKQPPSSLGGLQKRDRLLLAPNPEAHSRQST